MTEAEELELLELEKEESLRDAPAAVAPVAAEQPRTAGQSALDAAKFVGDIPIPGLAVGRAGINFAGETLQSAGGAISEGLGARGVPDLISAAAGAVPAIPGAVASAASTLIPGNLFEGALQAVAGPVGRFIGGVGSKLLPPLAKRAPNIVRAVEAAMSANILPSMTQITQSQALATAEEITARLPLFGRLIKSMRQAHETAFQELRTSAVERSGPSIVPSALGERTRADILFQVEAMTASREKALVGVHQKMLKAGGNRTTAEAAARELDAIRVARTDAVRKEAGRHYDELAEMISPDVDHVIDGNMRAMAAKELEKYKNIKSSLKPDAKALKILDDIKAGPGKGPIENAADPMPGWDALGGEFDPSALPVLMQRKTYTFQEMQTQRSTLNGLIHQENVKALGKGGGGTVEGRIYKSLKDALDDDIDAFGKSLSGDLKDKFDVATAYYKDSFKAVYANDTTKKFAELVRTNPKAVFESMVGRGNVVDIQKLKAAVGDQGFAPMRSLAVERLVTSKEGAILSGTEITKNLAAYGDEALREILTPNQLAEVVKYRTTRDMPKFIETAMEKKLRGVIFEREGVFRAPEDIVSRIISGDTATLRAVKNIVGPTGASHYRRRIVESILGEADNPNLLPGQVQNKSALRMGKALREYDESFLNEIFSKSDLAEIDKIDTIKALLESQPRLNAAPGTASSAISALTPVIGGGFMISHPIKTTMTMLSATVLSHFYVSKAGRMLLIEGLNPRTVKNMPLYTRLITAAANAARENAKDDGVNKK